MVVRSGTKLRSDRRRSPMPGQSKRREYVGLIASATVLALLTATLAHGALRLATADVTTTMSYRAIQSTYVSSAYPTKNFVTSKVLYTSGSPVKTSFLTFDFSAVPAAVQSAKLQLWARTSTSRGFDVHVVS